jgi:hypothetical protein
MNQDRPPANAAVNSRDSLELVRAREQVLLRAPRAFERYWTAWEVCESNKRLAEATLKLTSPASFKAGQVRVR